ncbi:MAG: hypothetical protein WCC35_21595, partial [Bradyrhizobium sp.]
DAGVLEKFRHDASLSVGAPPEWRDGILILFPDIKVTGQLEIRAYQDRTPLQKRNPSNMTGQLKLSTGLRSHSL